MYFWYLDPIGVCNACMGYFQSEKEEAAARRATSWASWATVLYRGITWTQNISRSESRHGRVNIPFLKMSTDLVAATLTTRLVSFLFTVWQETVKRRGHIMNPYSGRGISLLKSSQIRAFSHLDTMQILWAFWKLLAQIPFATTANP